MIPKLVSVLLPVFNQKNTLREAVDSVLSQKYSYLELIVINDGSTDGPEEILSIYNDPRVKYYAQPHAGLPRTLNYGLSIARGEFITWTSADNIMLPGMLMDLVAVLNTFPKYTAAYSGYYHIDAQGRIVGLNPKGPFVSDPGLFFNHCYREFFVAQYCNFGPAFLYRATACRQVGGFDVDCEGIEDVDYSLRIAAVGPVLWVPKLLYKYRLHEASMSGREKSGQISYRQGRARFWEKVRDNAYALRKEVAGIGCIPD
ncbi:glycosyltransferase [Desulfofundulus sp.]|uniref:glycosyltransferase n=1 Tax=Desulfofundulus sp. TaxID=2282750 RepID=UPI003C70CC54